ncbi:MAG: EamA family transporter [Clostridia bacterium]|nr:EamA family transporter [Clostridia bacterium]
MEKKNKGLLGAILVIGSGIMWGHSTYFVHMLTDERYAAPGELLSETGAAVTRLAFAFVMLAIYMLTFKRKELKADAKAVIYSILGGLIGMVFCTVIYYYSINENGSAAAAVLMYTSPAIVVVLSAIIFKERITKIKLISLILAFAGTVFVSGLIVGYRPLSTIGLIFGAITGVCYALYSIFSSLAMKNGAAPLTVIFYALFSASVAVMIYAAINGELVSTMKTVASSNKVMLLVFGQSSFDCVLPYLAYTLGVKYTGASKASIMSTTEIVVSALIAYVSFKEAVDIYTFIGIALVIGSIILLNLEKKDNSEE